MVNVDSKIFENVVKILYSTLEVKLFLCIPKIQNSTKALMPIIRNVELKYIYDFFREGAKASFMPPLQPQKTEDMLTLNEKNPLIRSLSM